MTSQVKIGSLDWYRLSPYWYDKTYGTNHMGLNGRIPSIEEIDQISKLKASTFPIPKALKADPEAYGVGVSEFDEHNTLNHAQQGTAR